MQKRYSSLLKVSELKYLRVTAFIAAFGLPLVQKISSPDKEGIFTCLGIGRALPRERACLFLIRLACVFFVLHAHVCMA